MRRKITEKTVEYIERPSDNLIHLKIKEGRYKGVIYTYGKVTFNEEDGLLKFNFNFVVNEGNSRYNAIQLKEDKRFKNFIAKVLIFVFESEMREGLEQQYKDKHGEDKSYPITPYDEELYLEEDDEHTETNTKENM